MEEIEKAGNSQLARELEVALPIELSREEQLRLVREYCSSQFVSKGMCADFNIHDTGSGNPHAHILLTMRPMDEQGKWLPKSKKEYVLDENGERIRLVFHTLFLISTFVLSHKCSHSVADILLRSIRKIINSVDNSKCSGYGHAHSVDDCLNANLS